MAIAFNSGKIFYAAIGYHCEFIVAKDKCSTDHVRKGNKISRQRCSHSKGAGSLYATNARFPFISYNNKSVKASLFGTMGNYMGYSGYYNPFTGEAQLNTTVPPFELPYVTCHEMAHQIGYATEDEANFVGYLTARSSKDSAFLYSVYVDLFRYANRELFYRDSSLARAKYMQLDTLVKSDLQNARKFYRQYDTKFGDVITRMYSQYLKANSQPQGINTYTFVVAWLIAYYKKYGEI